MPDAHFEQLVAEHYEGLYRFALSLARAEADACDLVQQTFLRWAAKGNQLRDTTKAKTWLFTTLHREFLAGRRRSARFPHHEVSTVEHQLPPVEPSTVRSMDGKEVMQALLEVDDLYRAPLTLFYLEEHSYKEIAEVLDIPIGTVMSRLCRGKEQIRAILKEKHQTNSVVPRIVKFTPNSEDQRHG